LAAEGASVVVADIARDLKARVWLKKEGGYQEVGALYVAS
jgi:hypothetical protein